MIKPHGNKLINLYNNRDSNSELDKPILSLTNRSISDLLLIANGAFSPITGFMNQEDYLSVLKNMRLSNNLVWSLPIVLPVSDDQLNRMAWADTIPRFALRPPALDAGRYLEFQDFLLQNKLINKAFPISRIAIDVTSN